MEDLQIIGLLFQRSESAIPALQQKFGGLCRSVIAHILPDQRDVEECISDTYLRVWNSIPPQRPARLDSFLARIARNVALDRYDYNTAGMRSSDLSLAYEELADYLPTGEQETDSAEFRSFINRFLRELPKESRVIFVRRCCSHNGPAPHSGRSGQGSCPAGQDAGAEWSSTPADRYR